MKNKKINKLTYYLLLFFSFSFLGGILEVAYSLIFRNKLVLGGFMYGIIRPIYGFGSLILYIMPKKMHRTLISTFLLSILIGSVYEYFSSYILELIFNKNWWCYEEFFLNINGRICLFSGLCWGVLGVIFYYVLEPITRRIYLKSNKKTLKWLLLLISIYYIFDTVVSFIKYIPIK